MAQISESDIGKRVTVRLRDGAGYRDIVGFLQSPSSLKNRHGEIVQFDPAQIYIWREITEVPRTATSGAPFSIRAYEIEELTSRTWPAAEEQAKGGWLLRADVGITKRANSALVLKSFENDNQIDDLITWYRERNLPPTVLFIPELNQTLDQKLSDRGFEKLMDMYVMVKDGIGSQVDFDYQIAETPSAEWLAVHNDQKILPLLTRYPAKYLNIKDNGKLVAIGRAAIAGEWAVLSRIWVAPERRGEGFGRKALAALEAEVGMAKIALQVSVDNKVAIELYQSAGYQIHHTCRFRALPQQINLLQDSCC